MSKLTTENRFWRVEYRTGVQHIRDLEADWVTLEAQCDDPYACFQSYAWCHAWAEAWCTDASNIQPCIYLIYKNDQLVALLPMMISHISGLKILSILGEPHTQTSCLLAQQGIDLSIGLDLLFETLKQADADAITLNAVPHDSPLAGFLDNEMTADPAEYMSITHRGDHATAQSYFKSLSRNRRRDFARKMRRLEDIGKLSHRTIPLHFDEFGVLARRAIEMKREWLKEKRSISSGLSWKDIDVFVENLARPDGGFIPEIQVLKIDDRPAAISINLVGHGMRSCYLSSYDLSLADASPGTVMHQLSIQQSIDEGLIGYNFLGHPTAFKTMWANSETPLLRYQHSLTRKGTIWIDLWANRIKPNTKRLLKLMGKSF